MNLIAFYNEHKILSIVIIIIIVILFFISIALGIGGLVAIIVLIVKSTNKKKIIIDERANKLIAEDPDRIRKDMIEKGVPLPENPVKQMEAMKKHIKKNKKEYSEEEEEEETLDSFGKQFTDQGFILSDDTEKKRKELIALYNTHKIQEKLKNKEEPKKELTEKEKDGLENMDEKSLFKYIDENLTIDEVIKLGKMNKLLIRHKFKEEYDVNIKIPIIEKTQKIIENTIKQISEMDSDNLYKYIIKKYPYNMIPIALKSSKIINNSLSIDYGISFNINTIKKVQDLIKKNHIYSEPV